MNSAPFVTTILPSYNHARYVAEAVQSVWAQDYPNHELVAIDDGSTDGSAEILWALAAESPIPMRVVARENRGLSATLNEGIAMSEAPYINFCASDDRLTPNKIRDLVGALEAADDMTAIAFGDRQAIDENGDPTTGPPVRFNPTGDRVFMDIIMGRVIMPAPGAAYRTEALRDLGGFDESVVLEDWEMWLKLSNKYKVKYVNNHVVTYRSHPGQTSSTRVKRISEDRIMVFERWVGKASDLKDPKAVREARAHIYLLVGADFYSNGYKDLARHWLAKSIVKGPGRRKPWRLLARATLGERPFAIARAIRDATWGRR